MAKPQAGSINRVEKTEKDPWMGNMTASSPSAWTTVNSMIPMSMKQMMTEAGPPAVKEPAEPTNRPVPIEPPMAIICKCRPLRDRCKSPPGFYHESAAATRTTRSPLQSRATYRHGLLILHIPRVLGDIMLDGWFEGVDAALPNGPFLGDGRTFRRVIGLALLGGRDSCGQAVLAALVLEFVRHRD